MTDTITSISDYLKKIKMISVDENSQIFYRGVPNEEYARPENNIPSIYRNKGWIENENKMFYELTSRVPEEFKDCQNTFEHLVKMQHYGYPTRLLDITSNPLVALYFACAGNNDEHNGQVIVYDIQKNNICNYESDRVALVANLAISKRALGRVSFVLNEIHNILTNRIKVDDLKNEYATNDYYESDMFMSVLEISDSLNLLIHLFEELADIQRKFKIESRQKFDYIFRIITSLLESLLLLDEDSYGNSIIDFDRLRLLHDRFLSSPRNEIIFSVYVSSNTNPSEVSILFDYYEKLNRLREIISTYLRSDESLDLFVYSIKKGTSHFNPDLIKSQDMEGYHCVLPKKNNPRLNAQQGGFLLFGFAPRENDLTTKPDMSLSRTLDKKNATTIIIEKSKKRDLLGDLASLGVSESTLFPEIDILTNELKRSYEI